MDADQRLVLLGFQVGYIHLYPLSGLLFVRYWLWSSLGVLSGIVFISIVNLVGGFFIGLDSFPPLSHLLARFWQSSCRLSLCVINAVVFLPSRNASGFV